MRKLACKTLMEILPGDEQSRVQQELTEKKLSVDFDTVVGLVVGQDYIIILKMSGVEL